MLTPRPNDWRTRAAGAVMLASAPILLACFASPPASDRSRAAGEGANVRIAMRTPRDPGALRALMPDGQEHFRIVEGLYPPALKATGIGGTVVVGFVILPNGTVDPSSLRLIGAGHPSEQPHPELAAASVAAVRRFEFVPDSRAGQRSGTYTEASITWLPNAKPD